MNDDFCGDENFICYYMYDSFLYFISGFMVVVTFSFGVLEVVFDEVLRTNHLSLKSKMAQKHHSWKIKNQSCQLQKMLAKQSLQQFIDFF